MPLPAPPVASPEPSSHSLSSPVAATSPPTVGNTVYLIPSPPTSAPPPAHPIRTRSKSGIFKPKVPFHLSNVSHSLSPIPRVYSEALRDPYWCQDMLTKYTAFIKNKTWDLVPCPLPSPSPPPPSTNVVSSMRIFRHKFHSNSSLDRYKERWLARGVNQQPGHDYDETFSPVVKPTTVPTVLTIAVSRGWSFLHSPLSEPILCEQSSGFHDLARPDYVCRRKKALYGLNQALWAWF